MLAAYSAGVLAGTFSVNLIPVAIAAPAIALLLLVLSRALGVGVRQQSATLVALFLIGLGYHAIWAYLSLASRIPESLAGHDLSVQVQVIDIPVIAEPVSRLQVRVIDGPAPLQGKRIQLSDYERRDYKAGQLWSMRVRLRAPRGLANPGGRDREAWYLQRGIRAVGYVRSGSARLLASRPGMPATRGWLLDRLLASLDAESTSARVLPALLLGVDSTLGNDLRSLFAATGTSHLFVISGLHIGLIATAVYFLLDKALRRVAWFSTRIAVPRLAGIGSLAAALCYALLSGFDLPAQRALVMIAALLVGKLFARSVNVWWRFSLALAVVLTLTPLAALSAGFWFSFVAVAVLLLTLPFSPPIPGLLAGARQFIAPQMAIFIGLLVPMSIWMGQVSLLAPVINLIAIPLIGLIVVPVSFLALCLALLSQPLAALLFVPVEHILSWFVVALEYLSSTQGSPFTSLSRLQLPAFDLEALIYAVLASAVLLVPLPISWRWMVIPLLLAAFSERPAMFGSSENERMVVRVFDVGQGLSLLVSVADRHLLYDTGAGQADGFSVAAAELLPAFRALGISELDSLLISHWDNDHAGGFDVIRDAYPGVQVLSNRMPRSSPHSSPHPSPHSSPYNDSIQNSTVQLCRAGLQWQWGAAQFRILHPAGPSTATQSEPRAQSAEAGSSSLQPIQGNESSCVLQIRYGSQSILVPGDIGRRVERDLVLGHGAALRSNVLIAPHHGSQTSSSYPLLKQVAPDWVVFSAGASNSFGHPAVPVVARYVAAGSKPLSTANSGMLTFIFDGSDSAPDLRRYRTESPRYWRGSQNDYWCRYYDQVCNTAL
jgi:competence protein ComEC